MPRIYASNNDPYDFCKKHYPKTEDSARQRFANLGDGPDGRGNCFEYDKSGENHPDYSGEDYKCFDCDKPLTSRDN